MTEVITKVTVNPIDTRTLVGLVVAANANLPLVSERIKRRHNIEMSQEEILAFLADDPTAAELLAKQLRMRATLTTYNILQTYQAAMLEQATSDDRPMSPNETVSSFNAASGLFNQLTQVASSGQLNINVFDKMLSMVGPDVREAMTTLVAEEPISLPPTPIRKRKARELESG